VLDDVVALIAAQPARPTLVGLTGPVSVGKTTIAMSLAAQLQPRRVAVISTDNFLFPNAELEARGISMKKGFPESYDVARLHQFLADARGGVELHAPVYDHLAYDIRAGEEQRIANGDIVIVEGVNALAPDFADTYDVTIYVDAPDDAVFEWFYVRLAELFKQAANDPTSFYAPFATWPDDQVRQFAHSAWDGINAVNLEQHIRPTRAHADVVIEKAADHAIARVITPKP
jgi:type I pantothenate kinase